MDLDPLGEWIWSPGWEGLDPGENCVKKISTHFLNGICGWIWTPLASGFGARDGRGSDPGENSVKKIRKNFLNGICGWIWTPPGRVDLEPGMEGGRIQGKTVLRKSVLIFLTVFADGFGPPRASGFGARDERGSDPGKIVLRKPVLVFLTVFADGFGPPWRVDLEPGMEGVGSRGK